MTTAAAVSGTTVISIAPGAREFSCLCEPCLERGRVKGVSFLELVREASVRGSLALEADVGFVRCGSGHRLIVRRVGRTQGRARQGERQLQPVSARR
jgi:hypothetical protein